MNFSKILSFFIVALFYIVTPSFGRTYEPTAEETQHLERGKRDHHQGVTGPVHTYVKTDKHANFKWGVRHHVGHHYAGRK